MNSKLSRGFTLIELLVVISIISLLSSVVLASLKDARDKAKGNAFNQSVQQLKVAIELYKSDNNSNLPQVTIRTIQPPNSSTDLSNFGVFSNYIPVFPVPPFTGSLYYYYYPALTCNGSDYMLLISGENKNYFTNWYSWGNGSYNCFPLN